MRSPYLATHPRFTALYGGRPPEANRIAGCKCVHPTSLPIRDLQPCMESPSGGG